MHRGHCNKIDVHNLKSGTKMSKTLATGQGTTNQKPGHKRMTISSAMELERKATMELQLQQLLTMQPLVQTKPCVVVALQTIDVTTEKIKDKPGSSFTDEIIDLLHQKNFNLSFSRTRLKVVVIFRLSFKM